MLLPVQCLPAGSGSRTVPRSSEVGNGGQQGYLHHSTLDCRPFVVGEGTVDRVEGRPYGDFTYPVQWTSLEPLVGKIRAEAAEQVVRLASHPSLELWYGNNENIWGWHDWGWQEELADRT